MIDERINVGSVVQLNEHASSPCYVGCFLLVTEAKSWGVQGFVAHVTDRDTPASRIYLRQKWDAIEWVGTAPLQPESEEDGS